MAAQGGEAEFDVIVVGAGFAGLYQLYRLRNMGLRVRVLEAGGGVGGTWYWNRYPGARCDIESMQYSYQFSPELQQEWTWTERYAAQPEILTYANHVADRFDLRKDISFNTRVARAVWNEQSRSWRIETEDGDTLSARYCIMATGCLSSPNTPRFEGLESFKGPVYHTGQWPHEPVDFTGKTVAVIGTGSSAVQSIPVIAAQAKKVYVFQRTPHWVIPARNRPLDPDEQRRWKERYPELRAEAKKTFTGVLAKYRSEKAAEASPDEIRSEYQRRWDEGGLGFMGAFGDLLIDDEANRTAREFVAAKLREMVKDPKLADALTPDYLIGCKRLVIDTGYYETFNKPHVQLVDISNSPIERITPQGVRANGREIDVDVLVLATGFDAMTGALTRIDIRGRNGMSLKEKWAEGPQTYLGLMSAGFPNLFMITGPGSPSVLTNMLPTIEQHVEWVSDCIGHMRDHQKSVIEPRREAEVAWGIHNAEVAGNTLKPSCSSWYVGANIPGKPRVFLPYMGGFPTYIEKCNEVVRNGYDGFVLN
jgi:cyclohexanone monooxygenase